jgi:hypothetical protein
MVIENGNNVIFPQEFIFYKGFVNTYKGMTVIQARRKLKNYYHRSMQDEIIRYLKQKGVITN